MKNSYSQHLIDAANVSDTGRKRPHNEDSTVSDTKLGLAIVTDGMGGYKAGEVASAIAAQLMLIRIRESLDSADRPHDGDQLDIDRRHLPSSALREAIKAANSAVFRTAQDEPECNGMGTTVAALWHWEGQIFIAHVGDSRVYRFRDDRLEQLTKDHSLVQELIDRGFYTSEEAAQNTPKNLVTRALGIEANVEVDLQQRPASDKDLYLLCSDGLTDMVNDEEIGLTLGKYSANLGDAAGELVRLANEKGGKDNVSVILVRPLPPSAGTEKMLARVRNWVKKRS